MDIISFNAAQRARKDAAQALLLAQTSTYDDPQRSLSSQVTFTKVSTPLFDTTTSGVNFPTIYWPWIIRVDGILGNAALGRYYLYFSTDHGEANGMVGLAYADNLAGPWTVHGQVYKDTHSGQETETPSVIYDPAAGKFVMFYQQVGAKYADNTSTIASQATVYATSTDGLTWTRGDIALDLPYQGGWPNPGHTGYFRPFHIGDGWHAYSLMTGTVQFKHGLSHSKNGRTFTFEPRPLGNSQEWLPANLNASWANCTVVYWRGRPTWIGLVGPYSAGGALGSAYIGIAPLAPDYRSLVGPPEPVIVSSLAWETDDWNAMHAFVDEGRLYVVYRTGNNTTKPFAFGLAYAEAAQ